MSHQGAGGTDKSGASKQVVDFNEARAQKLDAKRRATERIFFKQLLGVYSITANEQMRPIELIEVSEDGCSFQVAFDPTRPWPKNLENLPVRLYFSQDTYLPIHLKIQNSRSCIEEGTSYIRFGCTVDKSLSSYPAYQQFVRFLKLYSEHAHTDLGGASVFYL